jgi:molybdopterin-guanine dinucleotide biosynthesis protein A
LRPKKADSSDGEEHSDLGVIILAGGTSSRLKSNKVFTTIRGEPLIIRVVRASSEVSQNIVVAIGKKDKEEDFKILPSGIRVARDTRNKKAALYGALTGFRATPTEYAVVLAADLPFVNTEVIRILHHEAKGLNLAIPRWPNGNIEPLYAVYRVSAARGSFDSAVEEGAVRIKDAINRMGNVNYVPVKRFQTADPSLRCFVNVNTEADLEEAESILRKQTGLTEGLNGKT